MARRKRGGSTAAFPLALLAGGLAHAQPGTAVVPQGSLAVDRLAARAAASEQPARHGFGVVQPGDEAIGVIAAWLRRRPQSPATSFVPIIGHFECRDACMARM